MSSEEAILLDYLIESASSDSFISQQDVIGKLELEDLFHGIVCHTSVPENGMDVDYVKYGEVFNFNYIDTVNNSKGFIIMKHFIDVHDRIHKLQAQSGPRKEYIDYLRNEFIMFFATFLRGYTSNDIVAKEIHYSFARLLLLEQISESLMYNLINVAQNEDLTDSECFGEMFNPVLDVIRLCVSCSTLRQTDDFTMEKPYGVIKNLLRLKVGTSRPFAELIANRSDFCPKGYTGHRGKELSKLSFLGPFLSLGVCDIEGESNLYAGADRFFDTEHIPQDETRFKAYEVYQGRMNHYRHLMHDIIHPILVNTSTRDKVLDYLSALLKTNKKRSQIQADDNKLANDAFMVNLMFVLLMLSEKVTLDKVISSYIFHPKSRVDVKEETRLKATSEEVEQFESSLDLNYDPKFPTECFFMTIHAIHLSFNAIVSTIKRVKRHLQSVHQMMKETEAEINKSAGPETRAKHARLVEKLKNQKATSDRLVRTVMCMECTLRDRSLLDRILMFTNRQLSFLISMINPDYERNFELPDEPPKIFQMYPEMYLESALDFVVYLMNAYPQLLLELRLNLPQQLLMFICSTHFFNNPFLAAKVIDVVYAICPEINPPMEDLHASLVNTPLAINKLVPSLIKFYSDVENGTDFYEKFNIRRSMQVIFRSLWKMPIYRSKICEIARECTSEFVRFVNMVINDATYLLDESLANLKKIHDVENKMDNADVWNAISEEEKQRELDTLNEAKRSVRSWLIMGDDTMDMFGYLTKDVPQPFYHDPLGDRVASMLNHNLLELCSSKCINLKVKDGQRRFHWNPRHLLGQIVDVYLNLASEEFAECIAGDERSYNPGSFQAAISRIKTVIQNSTTAERFQNLAEAVKIKYEEKQKLEEDYGEEIPDEFCDPILATVMLDPVKLPSGIITDRKHILRHLLTSPIDPFSRIPCTPADLIPCPDLKARIEAWIKERKEMRNHGV